MSLPINEKLGKILIEYISLVGCETENIEKDYLFVFNGIPLKNQDFNKTLKELWMLNISFILAREKIAFPRNYNLFK